MNLSFKRIFPGGVAIEKLSEVDSASNLQGPGFFNRLKLKQLWFLSLFIVLSGKAVAPDYKSFLIPEISPIEPYKGLIHAIGTVESKGDTLAYNKTENAVGFFQIRQVRLNDFNKRTGNNYMLKEMYNYDLAEKVFLFYAYEIGPYNFEKIARKWNGSGPMTISYWRRVKKLL